MLGYLLGSAPFAKELMIICMCLQAARLARKADTSSASPNSWFLNLVTTNLIAFGGGWFLPLLLGRPSAMLVSADLNVVLCCIAYWLTFHSPGDKFWTISSTLPFQLLVTVFAQLLRSTGIPGTIALAFSIAKPSSYYPTALLGPILAGTLTSNVGLLYRNGYRAHFSKGMPWQFQNGFFCSAFLHLYINDDEFIGQVLRNLVAMNPLHSTFTALCGGEKDFALAVTSLFFLYTGVMQMEEFYGKTWSCFTLADKAADAVLGLSKSNHHAALVAAPGVAASGESEESGIESKIENLVISTKRAASPRGSRSSSRVASRKKTQ